MRSGMKGLIWLLVIGGVLVLSGCFGMHGKHHRQMKCANCQGQGMNAGGMTAMPMAADQAAQRSDLLYVCNCGPECNCNSVSVRPGDCACGKPMVPYHVVKVEGDEVLLCTCGANCACALDKNDGSKCGCGMAVKRVSLKGTGIYFCNCGGSCFCNTVSGEPGACKCGMPLKTIN
ncbi:hypothetical protein DSOUD_0558 [Desulfuromonas soudanensis]|uniref:Lipoprotein n=1 Tax=Desulfuromonas soudanensis TaxID=1603606 RepID=A0A0M4D476_9BACT|nr:hypothetical protein [Desulfuromonas soudanensis]ALC15347.1 hypothetical protein DSOUD_0558 [Desulfuromonas soudanensis]